METIVKLPRITLVDSLRGFALAGVALVHMTEQYIAGPPPEGFMEGVNGLPDQIVQGLIAFIFIGKFFAIFSFLFGLSFAIQMESAARRGADFSWRFLWRAVLLFGIGYVHQLFYRGDILTIYALLAPFLIPFHRISNKWILLVAGICFLSIPRFIVYTIFGGGSIFGLPDVFVGSPLEKTYLDVLQNGSLPEVMALNADYGMWFKMDFQLGLFSRFYYTFGYFLIGLWIGKIQLFRRLDVFLPKVRRTLKGLALAILFSILIAGGVFSTAPQPIDFSHWQHAVGINAVDWMNLGLAGVIVCGFILLYQKESWKQRLDFFVPYGRMALTNYLLQAFVGTFLMFGWGLGLLGTIRTSVLALMAIVLIVLQTLLSKWWLQHFRYGPLEWLWRSGTYLKWQPFRRVS